jgi:hypothetical protein
MVLQTTTGTRKWLSGYHAGTPTDTNATLARQKKEWYFLCGPRLGVISKIGGVSQRS